MYFVWVSRDYEGSTLVAGRERLDDAIRVAKEERAKGWYDEAVVWLYPEGEFDGMTWQDREAYGIEPVWAERGNWWERRMVEEFIDGQPIPGPEYDGLAILHGGSRATRFKRGFNTHSRRKSINIRSYRADKRGERQLAMKEIFA